MEEVIFPFELSTSIVSQFTSVPLNLPRSDIVTILLLLFHWLIEEARPRSLNTIDQVTGDSMVDEVHNAPLGGGFRELIATLLSGFRVERMDVVQVDDGELRGVLVILEDVGDGFEFMLWTNVFFWDLVNPTCG